MQAAADPDPAYYRPDVDPPRHRGLLAAAQRPFRAPGLRAPWYAVPGNHDLLVAGELARTPSTAAVAVGGERLVTPDAGLDVPRSENALTPAARRPRAQRRAARATTARRRPTPARRELTPHEAVAGLRAASGHGGTGARMDYAFDAGRAVRVIVLDTVRRDVGSGGVLAPEQTRWLARQLAAAGDAARDRRLPPAADRASTAAQAALALLDADRPRRGGAGRRLAPQPHRRRATRPTGGYWLVQTAALADYPQQARVLRVREAPGRRHRARDVDARHRARPAGRHRARARLSRRAGRAPPARGGHAPGRNVRLYRNVRLVILP